MKPVMSLSRLLPDALANDPLISGICDDSRQVESGDLFLAYPGESSDGRAYVGHAIANGAAAVAYEPEGSPELPSAGIPMLPVPQLRRHAGELAAAYWGWPARDVRLLGVTGTNGKSTCTSLMAQVYEHMIGPAGVIGTLGWGLVHQPWRATANTTPGAVSIQAILASLREQGARAVALEVSSHAMSQGRLDGLDVDAVLYTNLSRDHLDYHGSMEAYAAAKARVFSQPALRFAALNADDTWVPHMRAACHAQVKVVTYGLEQPADVMARDIACSMQGCRAHVDTPWGEGELMLPLLGRFNLYNALGVIALLGARGFPVQDVLKALAVVAPVPGRMQCVQGAHGFSVVVDYAHTPQALQSVLMALRAHVSGKLWCVFGCGGNRDAGKRGEMGAIAGEYADHVVLTSDNPRDEVPGEILAQIRVGMQQAPLAVIEDRAEAIRFAIERAKPGDMVLIAGKGHENYQEIAGRREPFDDVVCAEQALTGRAA